MKLTINQNSGIGEAEVIINCAEVDQRIRNLADFIRQYSCSLEGEIDGMLYYVPLDRILYIDSVDRRTFLYDPHSVYRSRHTLAELEERLESTLFTRISKNCIVNIAYLRCIRPLSNHRLEAVMANGEHLIVGRAYGQALRRRLEQFSGAPASSYGEMEEAASRQAGRSILNAGRVMSFARAPRRVVALSFGAAELMCALGQAERLVAIAPAEDTLAHVLPEYQPMLAQVPLIHNQGNGVPGEAELRMLDADLVICSWFFPQLLPAEARDRCGFPMYITESTLPQQATLETLYRDVLNLGRIFRAEDRAIALVERMRSRISALTRGLLRKPPVRAFVYDGRESRPCTALGGTLETDLIAWACGRNVFADQRGTYKRIEWAQVAEANPEVIVLHDYADHMSAAQKIAVLNERPELRVVPAIRDQRFAVVSLLEVFPGVQCVNTVEKLVRAFHPDEL